MPDKLHFSSAQNSEWGKTYRGEWAVGKDHVDCPYAAHFQPEVKVLILNLLLFTLSFQQMIPYVRTLGKKSNANLLEAKVNLFSQDIVRFLNQLEMMIWFFK